MRFRPGVSVLAIAAGAAISAPLAAEDAEDSAGTPAPLAEPSDAARIYEPDFFAQFAPRNALDMVSRIPGFSISGGNDQGQRGLGQADQNVIVNGERFSSKSDSLRDQLRRIPASDIVRIELVDGNTLDIPGLTGLVANVIYTNTGASGQFEWRTGFRAHNTEAQLYGGEISLTGTSGALDYTVSLSNDNNRFGADGPVLITAADGTLIEEQYIKFSGAFDNPKLSTNFSYDFGDEIVANLNLSYGEDFFYRNEPELAVTAAGLERDRFARIRENGPQYEIGADIEFPLGPGKLKLIGLERFERDNFSSTVIDRFDDGSDAQGSRFLQTNGAGERIGRFEYGWNMLNADWQFSGEAAFNRLDRVSSLFDLNAAGDFVELDFPAGTGGVTEDRYETSLSISRELSRTLSVQVIGAMEFSRIEQTGSAANSRSFKRPKGSIATSWKPSDDFDMSLTLARRVSQLSFGDFLASVSLNDDNENGGNNELIPFQTWAIELEANKRLGPWGSLSLDLEQGWFEDWIDWFPTADGGEARGNIGDAQRFKVQLTATINLDPLGLKGARIDGRAVKRWTDVTDPFTGESRDLSNVERGVIDADFRHDIPSTAWAWGAGIFSQDPAPYSRRYEFGRGWEGPVFARLFVENKDVLGLTVRATAGNILGASNFFERTVFEDPRPDGDILFHEEMDRRIGPIFRFSVSGDF
ncbi:TonB-dependent receptor plug domain-containing protein [Qipengyuania sp. 1NDH10]|nr:TonB-dependent receptor plug domain-containing protein [Qipengyuania vesicularis]